MEVLTQSQLLAKHVKWAKVIGVEAIENALESAGISKGDIKFLVVCTSTGFTAPGLTAHIVNAMGLSPSIQRADIVGMGCHAGLNGVQTAANWAQSNRGLHAVVLCCEICSAAYVWDSARPTIGVSVVNSLFGDAAAATVVLCPPHTVYRTTSKCYVHPTLIAFESYIIPNSLEALYFDWDESHGKYSFILSPTVPYDMALSAPHLISALLAKTRVKQSEIKHWVVHSGGKKVLDCALYSLNLCKYDVRHTLSSLQDLGNVSSGAFIFAYKRLVEEGRMEVGDYGVFMTMGPGAGLEAALFRVDSPNTGS
jgi:alkylresorcinol/alkylpyrone synthase/polyketide synthase Type III